jgi:hypothetical protein
MSEKISCRTLKLITKINEDFGDLSQDGSSPVQYMSDVELLRIKNCGRKSLIEMRKLFGYPKYQHPIFEEIIAELSDKSENILGHKMIYLKDLRDVLLSKGKFNFKEQND